MPVPTFTACPIVFGTSHSPLVFRPQHYTRPMPILTAQVKNVVDDITFGLKNGGGGVLLIAFGLD